MKTQTSLPRKISHYFYDHRNGEISAESYLYVRNHGYDETTCTIIVDSWIAMHAQPEEKKEMYRKALISSLQQQVPKETLLALKNQYIIDV